MVTVLGSGSTAAACRTYSARFHLHNRREAPGRISSGERVRQLQVELPTYQVVTVEGRELQTFRCEPHEATVTTTGCAGRFTRAQGARRRLNGHLDVRTGGGEAMVDIRAAAKHNMDACQRCPLGALHAGVALITHSVHYASDQCPRCGYGTNRMIAGRVCVNCYNREREVRAGRNGRGNAPVRAKPIHAFALRLVIDNGRPVPLADTGVSPVEVICRQLRITKGSVAFAPRRRDLGAQMRLFG